MTSLPPASAAEAFGGVARCRPDAQKRTFHLWGTNAPHPAAVEALLRGRTLQYPASIDAQWAAANCGPNETVTATSSTTVSSGLFWARDGEELVIGPRLGQVLAALTRPTRMSDTWLAEYLHGSTSADQTPYDGVYRIPPGTTAQWRDASTPPELAAWSGPDTWPTPHLRGDDVLSAYLTVFDAAVDQLCDPDRPLCSTLSGGLDSTFVVASLARHASADRPVHAFVHRPHPDAGLQARGNWDADEFAVATMMARRYPGRVKVTALVNNGEQPLDVAAGIAGHSWMPAVNVDNEVWLRGAQDRAQALGAGTLFTGENGNAAFSYGHPYAAGYYSARADLSGVMRLVWQNAHEHRGIRSSIRGSWLSPLRRPAAYHGRWLRMPDFALPRSDRASYLDWLAADGSYRAVLQPLPSGMTFSDPFTAARVMSLAAAIEPSEWSRGPLNRSLARRLGTGRIPNEIRLRTRRGGQSWDAWYTIRHQRQRYLDLTSSMARDPDFCDLIDVPGLAREVTSWPWGQTCGPSAATVGHVNRLLHLFEFVTMTRQRLIQASRDAREGRRPPATPLTTRPSATPATPC